MFGKQLTLLTLLGFKVKVDVSWLFLALLISWSLATGYFPATYEDLTIATYWSMSIAGVAGFVVSLVFHELSHSIVARRYGLPIKGITLFVFGGVAEMEEEPQAPKTEFLMAIAGPIASFILAVAFYATAAIAGALDLPLPVRGLARYLGFLNGLLAVFNLVPAFPLDGGRVLRSALWYWKGDLRWATRVAAHSGEVFGFVLIGFGVLSVLGGNFVGGMWLFLIGLFLRSAAAASYYQLMVRRALEGEPVRRFMTPHPITVSRAPTLLQFVEDYVYRYHHDMFPVQEGSRLLGCVTIRAVKDVPKDRWSDVTIGEIIKPCGGDNTIDADEDTMKVLSLMRRTGNNQLMVTESGQLVGIIVLKDMMKLLALKVDLDDIQ